MMIALVVAKAGYYGGDPGEVMKAPVDDVLTIVEYEKYQRDYEEVFMELNKD